MSSIFTAQNTPWLSRPQNNNRVVSFSKERAYLADYHLNVDSIPFDQRPLESLLTDHLSQGVFLHCLHPRFQNTGYRTTSGLSSVAESLETPDSLDSTSQKSVVTVEDLESHIGRLSLEQERAGRQEPLIVAHSNLNRFKPKERERGEGKDAFETYLAMALSI